MTTSYEYDGLDRQLGYTTSAGGHLDYQMEGDHPLTETNQTTARVNLYGNGLVSSGGEYPLMDGRGNVRLTLDGGQQVTSSNAPDAFGVGSATSNTASPYQWQAGSGYRTEGLAAAGLSVAYSFQKVGARYYDPTLGCFLTRDTVLSQKPYAYCDGDPVNCTDPSGHVVTNPLPNIFNDGFLDFFGSTGADGTFGPISVSDGNVTASTDPAGGGSVVYSTGGVSVGITESPSGAEVVAVQGVYQFGSGFSGSVGSGYNLGSGATSATGSLDYSSGGFSAGYSSNDGFTAGYIFRAGF